MNKFITTVGLLLFTTLFIISHHNGSLLDTVYYGIGLVFFSVDYGKIVILEKLKDIE